MFRYDSLLKFPFESRNFSRAWYVKTVYYSKVECSEHNFCFEVQQLSLCLWQWIVPKTIEGHAYLDWIFSVRGTKNRLTVFWSCIGDYSYPRSHVSVHSNDALRFTSVHTRVLGPHLWNHKCGPPPAKQQYRSLLIQSWLRIFCKLYLMLFEETFF
jgi:hypothetical protein